MKNWPNTKKQLKVFKNSIIGVAVVMALGVFPLPVFSAETVTPEVVEKAIDKTTEKAVEKAVERAVEKVAEEAVEKSEQSAGRPAEWQGPTKVYFLVFVLDIDEIDDANQNFTTNVFIRLRWQDDRQANPNSFRNRQVPLDEIWNPQVLLANRQGLVSKSLPEIVHVSPDGNVVYRQRYTGKLSQPLRLSDFPMDQHLFTIQFVAAGYDVNELEFLPDKVAKSELVGGAIADQLSLPDWHLLNYEARPLRYQPIAQINSPGFAFQFEAKRFFSYYLWQIVLPLSVVIAMSWAAFWIESGQIGVRIAVSTSSILTLIAHRFVLANLLPRLPYMTRMDYFTVGSTLFVFMALIVVVFTSFLASKKNHNRGAKILNVGSRFVFPAAYLLLLWWFIFG